MGMSAILKSQREPHIVSAVGITHLVVSSSLPVVSCYASLWCFITVDRVFSDWQNS